MYVQMFGYQTFGQCHVVGVVDVENRIGKEKIIDIFIAFQTRHISHYFFDVQRAHPAAIDARIRTVDAVIRTPALGLNVQHAAVAPIVIDQIVFECYIECIQIARMRQSWSLFVRQNQSFDVVQRCIMCQIFNQLAQTCFALTHNARIGLQSVHKMLRKYRKAGTAYRHMRLGCAPDGCHNFGISLDKIALVQRIGAIDVTQRDPHKKRVERHHSIVQLAICQSITIQYTNTILIVRQVCRQIGFEVRQSQRIDRIGVAKTICRNE